MDDLAWKDADIQENDKRSMSNILHYDFIHSVNIYSVTTIS